MHNWKIGDLAKCIADTESHPETGEFFKLNSDYVVADSFIESCPCGCGNDNWLRMAGYKCFVASSYFVPLTPAKKEPKRRARASWKMHEYFLSGS